jgi:glycosyltransferase involved in cell wall biosynthesis
MTTTTLTETETTAPSRGTTAADDGGAPAPPGRQSVSVLIITKNEELNIAACLKALSFSDDIVVLDSLSTDRTLEIARQFPNVRTVQRPFDIEWRHRNWGLHDIPYKNPWVYICDADERVPEDLATEILHVVNQPQQEHVAYRLRYRNMYLGKWIKHASSYPVWIMRLVRPQLVTYEVRETNVHPIVQGSVGSLDGHFIHYSFNSGLKRWFQKHNFYSTREAMEGVKVRRQGVPRLGALRSADPMVRRRALKNLSYFVTARAFFRFLLSYVIGGGFMDGIAGMHYCFMIAMYEYWIELKIAEQEADWRGGTNRLVKKFLRDESDGEGTENEDGGSKMEDGAKASAPSSILQPPPPSSHAQPRETPLIEVMIPTLNEADHIVEAVTNARKLGPVFVLDSLSTDGTQELARQAGATVVEHPFVDYSSQKNWGLDHLPFGGEWVFILDADERITPELREEVLAKVSSRPRTNGYYINRKLLILGRDIQHGGLYPSWNLRLFRRGKARYENRSVHEHVMCTGRTDYMRQEMLHVRRESISHYLEKHIRYADMESDEWVKWKLGKSRNAPTGELFRDTLRWRQWVRRNIWPRLPARPLWRFIYMYFFRFAFLDGKAGWHLAELMACYEYMITLLYRDKLIHAARAEDGTPVAGAGVAARQV